MDVEFIMNENAVLKKLRTEDLRNGTEEAVRYCTHVILPDLARKMQQDISVHHKKLTNILEETLALNHGKPSGFGNMISCIIDDHRDTDANITLDVAKTCFDLNVNLE